MNELRFDRRVAIVTGGGSGLGRSHSLLLADRGARVAVNGRPSGTEEAEAVCEEIRGRGGEAIVVPGQIGDSDHAEEIVARTVEAFGRVDIVVNNAGNAYNQDLPQDSPGEALERLFDLHVRGPLQVNRAAWPHMVAQGYGRILFTGSNSATGWLRGSRGYELDYATAKAALFGVTRQTAGAGLEHGIKANLVMPMAYTKQAGARLDGSPLGRWLQENFHPHQVSAGIALLLHETCPVTGEFISAEGGRVARIFFAATIGYYNPHLTPEDVQEHWAMVQGGMGDDGSLLDAFEQTFPREQQLVTAMIESGALPDGAWIAQQPLGEMILSATDRHDDTTG